jgi:hypothetical protein
VIEVACIAEEVDDGESLLAGLVVVGGREPELGGRSDRRRVWVVVSDVVNDGVDERRRRAVPPTTVSRMSVRLPVADAPESITVSDAGFTLPTSELLTGRGFVTGKSGSGKSNSTSVIAEELLEHGLPLLIVDTDGEYYGLKSRYELLHVGAEADCDVTVGVEHAGKLAELALVQNVPVILDVSGYVEEDVRHELVLRVVERLFELGKRVRKPFPLFVEEIHEFLPQSGGLDELGETLITIAKRGRKRGIGICGMSQRPAAVDKDFITQCDWVVWHRLTWDNDKRVAAQMLGSEVAAEIDDLDTGEALLMTDWDDRINRVRFRPKRTFDAGATPDLDDLDAGAFSPVRTGLIKELSGEGGDLNDVDLEELGGQQVPQAPAPAPEGDLDAAAETAVERAADTGDSTALETSPATEEDPKSDIVTVPSRPAGSSGYRPPEPTEDEPFDPVWELGHLTVYLFSRVGRGTVATVSRLVDGAVWAERRLRRDLERAGRALRQRLVRPAVYELEGVAAQRVPDRLIAATVVVLLVIAIILLLVS